MKDVYGKIMLAAKSGKEAKYIIERDDGHSEEDFGTSYFKSFDKWAECEKLAITNAKGKILDIGCGAGRVAIYLQEKGHDVVGIDISQGALEVCKERGVKNAHLMSIDSIAFPDSSFDTILLFGNTFGMLGSHEKIIEMLHELYRVTTNDGIILASSRDPRATDNPAHLSYHKLNKSRGFPIGFVRFRLLFNNLNSRWYNLLHVSPDEMASLSIKAGWRLEKIYGPLNFYVGLLRKT